MNVKDDVVICPSCRNENQVLPSESRIVCATCGDEILLAGHMCPICFTYHEEDEIICTRCGTPLTRICQICRHTNWSGHEKCINCGQSLELLSQYVSQKGVTAADRLQEHMDGVGELKQMEESDSVDRMAEMVAIEERRQQELRRRAVKRQQEERRVIIIVAAALVFFIFVLFILLLVSGGI